MDFVSEDVLALSLVGRQTFIFFYHREIRI